MITTNKYERRERRKKSVRRKIQGTSERPRLSVYRSLSHFYAQVIDDAKMHTVVAASSADKELKDLVASATSKTDVSKMVGELLAKRATAAGVKSVVFDRNGYIYHGRVKAFADAAREAGLHF
ncbi:MAG: 50S ribosomal protein L18 [Candidatus Kapaibacteriota bacterium]|jgi:large subunit ribosomal protein L18